MPDQFVVPQFIDAEDKILGPLTARQFIILMVGGFATFTLYKLLTFTQFLLTGIPIILVSGVVAFVKINGQPFHFFMLNIVQTLRKPKLRVWDKSLTDAELKIHLKEEAPPPPPPPVRKAPLTSSRLQELSLVVNTGGVYKPEE
jgi:hypothetical protein